MNDDVEAAGALTQTDQFLIVGLGASAGGIDALRVFFRHVQKDSGAAYVVVLHLSPHHESQLAELLQSVSPIPVIQARERIRVEPDHAYVIPPNQTLSMDDGYLALSPITTQEERRAPIDIFFLTLAESQRSRAVCVVLSGTGADGSPGLKRVKERGGLCIAQDPDEAAHGEMPRHAIETQHVDAVLNVRDIPARIAAYGRHRDLVLGRGEVVEADEHALRGILSELRLRTGHDFASYKRSSLLRRIQRRIALHELRSFEAYAQWLRDHPEEARALLKDLLISVTSFFRDPAAFQALEREVVPKLFEHKGVGDHLRVWVAGCATGEEVYSVAMLLCEQISDPLRAPTIQIFATDIDEAALAKARAGFYTESDVAAVSAERVRRFFVRNGEGYRVRQELRELVLFAAHNVIRHPPYSQLDLITCRNLLIYINRPAQQRVSEVFHFGLQTGGFLFIGSSESLDGASELFAPVDKEARIFRSRAIERRIALSFANLNVAPRVHAVTGVPVAQPQTEDRRARQAFHQRLLEHYAPPSLIVNEAHEIVHMSDRAGRYLSIPGGEPSMDLLTLIRPELRIDLRMALYEAAQQRTQAKTRPLAVSVDGVTQHIVVAVDPVREEADGFILVVFEPAPDAVSDVLKPIPMNDDGAARHLEDELIRAKAQLGETLAQHELQQEELRASNEELQSINEELRSATEELETGKEELQSYNEELSTVNQELKVKVEELTQAHNDTRNLMNSTDTATVFLDKTLRIKRFTPHVRELFNVLPADAGRPLLDITHNVQYAELASDIAQVNKTLQSVEREIQSNTGAWFIAKVMPYRTEDDRIDGVVLTFTDFTARKLAEDKLRQSEEQFRRAMEEAPIPVVMQAEDGEVLQLSRSWSELTGYTMQDIPTMDAWLSRAYGDGADAVRDHMQQLFAGKRRSLDVEFAIRTRAGEERHWSFSASSAGVLVDGRRFIVGMAVDVTERKRLAESIEMRVRDRTNELAAANEALRLEMHERGQSEELRVRLLSQLVDAQENERRRLARELHDQFGQQLTALTLKLKALGDTTKRSPAARAQIEDLQKIVKQLDDDVDFLVWELRPTTLDDLGLIEALVDYVAAWSKHVGVSAHLDTSRMGKQRLPSDTETVLYRVVQEALNNVARHAAARNVDVLLEQQSDHVSLIVEDDGVGFDADSVRPRGSGLIGMRERAAFAGGTLTIESNTEGTTVFLRVPTPAP